MSDERPAHWFKKGVSGNPSGRPALPAEVREAIRSNGQMGVARMNQILHDDKAWGAKGWLDAKTQIKLAEVAMVRAYGSAAQAPIGAGAAEGAPEEVRNMGEVLRQVYHAMMEENALPEFIKAQRASEAKEVEPEEDGEPEEQQQERDAPVTARRSRQRRDAP